MSASVEAQELRAQLQAVMGPLESAGLEGLESIRALCACIEGPPRMPVHQLCGLVSCLREAPEYTPQQVVALLRKLRDSGVQPSQVRIIYTSSAIERSRV